MRTVGVTARGIRLPIISPGDDLAAITVSSLLNSAKQEGYTFSDGDVVGITEAIVAKSQNNYATLSDITADIAKKFPGGTVGLTFPILSRNRFLNVLKGISKGADKVYILFSYPADEVGNPLADAESIFENERPDDGLLSEREFIERFGLYRHPFTDVNYIELYKSVGSNIEIYFSKRVTDILKLTPHVLECSIHTRDLNASRLRKAGAETVYTLADILSSPGKTGGYNDKYGVLGSNMAAGELLKLFPRDPSGFVEKIREDMLAATGKTLEVLVYGDGAFKDPLCGIWELADPVTSPAYTSRLAGSPKEIKLKLIADSDFGHLKGEEKQNAVTKLIAGKDGGFDESYAEGTTPRRYYDLLASLCDLMSGSGDKGTPVVLIKGYFDDYSSQ